MVTPPVQMTKQPRADHTQAIALSPPSPVGCLVHGDRRSLMSGGSNAGDRIHWASGVPSAWQDVTTLLGTPGSSAIRRGSHGHVSLFPPPRPNTGDPSSPGSPSFLHVLPHPVP